MTERPIYTAWHGHEVMFDSATFRAEATQRWLAKSGPQYADVEIEFIDMRPDGVAFIRYTEDGEPDYLAPDKVSYASSLMLELAKPGEVLTVKIRIDDLGCKR